MEYLIRHISPLKLLEGAREFGKLQLPYFAEIGFRERGKKNMSQGYFLFSTTLYFENFNAILPNDGRDRFFDVDEVEIYKIVFY